MTRPTRFSDSVVLLSAALGYDPDADIGNLPNPVDYALSSNGGYAVVFKYVIGDADDVNALHGTDSNASGMTHNFSDPTYANDGNDATTAIRGLFAAGAGTYTCGLVADLGSGYQVTGHAFDGSMYTAHDDVIAIHSSDDGAAWTERYSQPFYVGEPVVTHGAITARYWRVRLTTTLTGLGAVGQARIRRWAITGAAIGAGAWSEPAPNVIDGDDASFHVIADEADVVRIELPTAIRIVRADVRIGTETSGSRTYSIWGANAADFSDQALLDSTTFTATGSFTAQDVVFNWTTSTAYRYFMLSGNDETRNIYSFELYEGDTESDHSHTFVELTDISSLTPTNGDVLTWNGSAWGARENVRRITSNSSNTLVGPFVNFASGSGIAFAASSNTLTISGGAGVGGHTHELDYVEYTSPVTVSATAEASATTIVTGTAIVYDGLTDIIIEYFAPYAETSTTSADTLVFWLYDGSSSIGAIGQMRTPAAALLRVPVRLSRRLTPSNGSHTYSVRGTRTSANAIAGAGAGGAGNNVPGYIRITRAV